MTEKTKKWNPEAVATLTNTVGAESPVSADAVERAATALGLTARSIAAKLRQLGHEVASLAKERVSTFSAEQGVELAEFVQANAGTMTYVDIAAKFPGNFSPKQIQGKLLALELTGSVKAAEKIEAARTYTPEEEKTFVSMVNSGKFIEDIANVLGKSIASVRGKALSLTRSGVIQEIPKQRESHATTSVDVVASLGDAIATMTVADIAAKSDKTERGIKTTLTRRGIKVADYDGAAKKAKAEAKLAATA